MLFAIFFLKHQVQNYLIANPKRVLDRWPPKQMVSFTERQQLKMESNFSQSRRRSPLETKFPQQQRPHPPSSLGTCFTHTRAFLRVKTTIFLKIRSGMLKRMREESQGLVNQIYISFDRFSISDKLPNLT